MPWLSEGDRADGAPAGTGATAPAQPRASHLTEVKR